MKSIGVIAQEIIPIIPEAVTYNIESDEYHVNYNVLYSAILAELIHIIHNLKSTI